MSVGRRVLLSVLALAVLVPGIGAVRHAPAAVLTSASSTSARPDILLITVDTLRADRLGSYGYSRPTSPAIDRILNEGVRFTRARTVEPLTNPSISSMLTSLYPQEHGASRNGLRIRPGLDSLPKTLHEQGYTTAAFVGNWTLRDKLSGLGEHFDSYAEILTRKRWFGFLRKEATAEDLTDAALEWLDRDLARRSRRPFLLWVHYVEPHAPYRLQEEYRAPLGIPATGKVAPADRYDTEIAFADHHIARLVEGVRKRLTAAPLIVFASDHGESLGEHDYWGHGRQLYETTLWIPMGFAWPGHLRPTSIGAPALNIDLAPTILGVLGLPAPKGFEGYDWTPVLEGGEPPTSRVTRYQAHRGAVISKHESELARRRGLIAVAMIHREYKEILELDSGRRGLWNLEADPKELHDLAKPQSPPTEDLMSWTKTVRAGLASLDSDATPPEPLDEKSAEKLRALGYVD